MGVGSLGDPQERKEQAEQGIEINNHTLTTSSCGDAGKGDDPMCMRGQGEEGTGRSDLQLARTWPPSRERLDTPRAAGGNRVSVGQGQDTAGPALEASRESDPQENIPLGERWGGSEVHFPGVRNGNVWSWAEAETAKGH